jgi:hypothetical protein
MQIVINVTEDADGRLSGTAGPAGGGVELPFSGRMELLDCLEQLCTTTVGAGDPGADGATEGATDAPSGAER